MRIDVITLFPDMFSSPFELSMMKRARENGILNLQLHNLRTWAVDAYGSVDDHPFGGGVGMILRIEPIYHALTYINSLHSYPKKRTILLSARGKRMTQRDAERWSRYDQITLICGHYEDIDARVEEKLVDESVSIGDYVLTGGELPAMVLIDATVRLLRGVLGKHESTIVESFSKNIHTGKRVVEAPQYTRPQDFMGMKVPDELLSGDPKIIQAWKEARILEKRKTKRK